MTSRTFLIAFVLLLVISTSTNQPAFAQETSKQAAVKFDEFGDIEDSTLKAILDGFAIELQNKPSVKGFIIVYRSRRDLPGLSSRLAVRAKNFLLYSRGIDAERIITIDGGEAECLMYELWIVPVGETPKLKDDIDPYPVTDIYTTKKFDEYSYSLPEGENITYSLSLEARAGSIDAFGATLRRQPRLRGYVIAYAQYYVERGNGEVSDTGREIYKNVYLDPTDTAKKMLQAERNYLVKTYGIASSRIVIVDGGYRKERAIELWTVPRGEHAPIATPNAFPKQRAKRRAIRRR